MRKNVIRVRFYKASVFVITSFTSSIAGILLAAIVGTANPKVATDATMFVISAVVIGGTSMAGGKGNVPRTVVGLLILGVLANGMSLLNIRYDSCFKYIIEVAPEILHFGILKNLLQPLLENYIVHGFNPDNDNNSLVIKGFLKENRIYFEISDNGKGINRDQLEKLNARLIDYSEASKTNMGLANVSERIRVTFGEGYGLKIESDVNEGTLVTVNIPSMEKEEIKKTMFS